MPKYILKDSTGQVWEDIDDTNISEFMEQYPGAEIIETIDDVIEVENDIENLKQEPVSDSIDSPESIKEVVSDYDTNAIALKEAFRDVSIEGRSQLNDTDFELAKNGQWDEISENGKNVMLNLYPTTGRFDEDKPKDFDSLKNYLAQVGIDTGVGAGIETSSYDDYNILGSSFASAQENADKRNQFKNDLNSAINNTKKGEIPTNVLTGGLGEVIIGNEEEKVADTLSKLYSPYGFQFSKSDSGLDYFTDDLIVQAGNGKKIKIKLDNWTSNGDKEQAEVLKNFLENNKEEYQQNTFQNILKKSSELNERALETSNEDTKWYDNFLTDIEKVSEDQEREWNNVYDERIVKQETKSVETQLVQLNTEYSLNQAKINKFTNDAAKLQSDIDNGLIPLNDIKQRQIELETLRVELKEERSVLDNTWGQKIKPAIADLTVVAAKQSLVEEGRGSFGSMTAFAALKPWENIGTYLNGISLASAQGEIEDIADGDEVKLKKLLDREAKMVVFDGFTKNIDISNEYQQAFQESMAGAAYSSIINMASIALPSLAIGALTAGIGGKIAYGVGMGAHIAGGELAEMQTEDFAGMSPKEKLAFASTVGAVSGAIEGVFGPGGTLLGKGLLKGVSKIAGAPLKAIRNKVLSEVLKKTVGKKVSQSFIKKTAKEVSEKLAKTGVIGKITSEFVKGGLIEAATEITQEAATLKLKQVWAENSETNSPLWSEAAKEITFDKLAQAGVLGFLAGGPFGAMSGGVEASKAGKVAELKQMQYRMYKNHMLNPKWQNLASSKELLNVLDPKNKLTEEGAKKVLRNFNEAASVLREVDGLGLTIEGEQKAVDLINQKRKLQKQIDKATDKALVKKQREEITAINSSLEDLSVNYNFEAAYEAGVEQAREATEASGKSFTEFNSSKEFEAKMKELGEQDEKGFKGTSGYIDNDGNIYINREAAKNLRDISVGQHELLHGVVGKQLGNVAPETVQGFKNSLTSKELQVVEKRLKDDYGVTSVEDANAEEYFNALVDGVVQGDIVYDENVFTKIGNFIVENILRPMGFSNTQLGFENGRQVYNFVKDYAKQSRRIAQGKQEGFEGEVGDIVAEGTAGRTTGAKSAQSINATDLAAQYKDGTIDSDNITNFIEQYHKLGLRAMKFDTSKGDIARDEAVSFLNKEFESVVKNYDPAKNIQFSTYLNSVIPKRAVNFYEQQIGDKAKTTSTDSDQAKQIAADDTPTKDSRTPREIRQAERKGVKVREKTPGVYNIDAVVKSIRDKAKGKSFKGKNIKQLKGFALREVVDMITRDDKALADSLFKKITKDANLKSDEMLAIQKFINSNIDLTKGSLLEGYTSEFKSTGVNKKLLEKFYNKRSARAKTKPGLQVQIKKPNISDAEFKEAFGITGKDQANWNQKVVASKGGVSDILKGFVRNFDQVVSSQEIREQLIQDGETIEALRTLSDGIPSGFFSKNLKDIKNEGDLIKVAELMMSDNFLNNADLMRKTGASDWLYKAFDGLLDKEFIKSIGGGRISQGIILLKKIASDFQLEFDPNKSWQDYIKKSNNIAISEAKLGVRTNLKTIAKAKGIDVDTGTGVVNNLDSLNVLRVEIVQLINELKAEGISDNDISKYIISALTSPARLGGFDLTNDQALTILKDSDVKKHSKVSRLGIFGSVTDKTNQTGVDGERINSRIYEHGKWFNVAISLEQAKKYGVEKGSSFNDLPLSKRKAFIKNEIKPEGLKAKKILDTTTKIMVKLFKEGKLSAQTAVSFIEMQFASMDGLGKLASDVRFIPTMTKNEIINLFNLPLVKRGRNKDGSFKYIKDPFVLEHTIPGHRIKTLMFNAILSGDKASMDLFEAELEQYHSAIIPIAFDKQVNYKDGKEFLLKVAPGIRTAGDFALSETGRYSNESRFPISLLDVDNDNVYGQAEQLQETIEESRESNGFASKQSGVQTSIDQNGFFSKTNEDIINDFSKMDKALDLANSLDQPVKKIRVFDFDDTLAYTKSDVLFTAPDGSEGKLNAEEFAKQGKELLDQGYKFDFSEFNKVNKGRPGPLLDIAKKINEARGNEDLFVLTARAPEAQQAIYEFLKSQGIEFKKQNIVGLGNSTGEAKAEWLVNKAAEGYNDFYFADDAMQNVSAVEKAMSVLDVKSKVQQAKGRFSKQMSNDFNRIIEETEGVGRQKVYSEARAKQVGSQKGKRKFWIPYSAEDMLGLIYPLLGKGKTGDAQIKFFKDNLFNPFSKAMESLAAARVQLMADFKALKENLDVPKDLQKEAFDGFTNEQALRMYIWDLQGMEIPGISKRDLADAKKIIEGDSKLKTFAEELIKINKQDGYPKPSQSWLAGTITTDLIEGLNDIKRPRYLQQWQQNVDAIFSKENLNKLEAIHGSNYREALENMLTRMKTGKNRIEGSNRMSDRVLDWINGSVGAIMFFNTRSAVLQLISSINFINWNDNNLYAAGKAFANQKQYWADFKMLMNSDFLVDRRNGLKINVSESEIADAAKTSKNKARAVLNYILKKGFLPTQIADSFAIASGGATFYRNRVNTYISQGMTKAEAEAKAFQDFRETSEESQQSSRPDKVSQQQASSLGRVLLAFANTPMQYGRLTKRAYQDLINGRGDRKSNISKIIYYTAVQNMIFNVLQQAVTMLGFGDDEKDDKEKEEKYVDIANGMADSILRGLGIAGGAVSVAKNFLLDLYERSGRTRPEYVDSVYKLLQFSPPISSKVSKIRQAAWMFDSKKRRKEIYDKGFALDNPAYEAAGKVISATTNLPVDRVYNKVNNIDAALAEDTETWESVAMLLGWPEWQIKPKPKYKSKSKSKKSGYKSRSGFKKRKNNRRKIVFK